MDRSARARATWTELEDATLRIRLGATALAATVLLLVPGHDQVAAGSVLLGYTASALIFRAVGNRVPASGTIGVGVDVLFATALSLLLPFSAAWVLYVVPIAVAALRGGVPGVAAAVAACVVAYDVVLVVRGGDALAADLWRIQVLLAFGVVAAELIRVSARSAQEQRALRAYSLAQRDLAAADGPDAILDRLVDHAVRSFGARAAWIDRTDGSRIETRHVRGADRDGRSETIPLAADTTLRATFADDARVHGAAALHDLALDARPLLEAARHRVREEQERVAEGRALDALARFGKETTIAGVLAETITMAQEIAGPAAIVRVSTGERLVGDLDAAVATAIARDGLMPRLVHGAEANGANAPTAAAVGLGQGLALICAGTRRELTDADLRVLARLGDAADATTERLGERATLLASEAHLRVHNDELQQQLRDRDDAVASAVHELRNPLTSVQAYGQLISRHLASVQQQVTQLDSIIEDLLPAAGGATRRPLALETADVAREAAGAVARVRVAVPGTEVRLTIANEGAVEARLDPARFAQVLDNVLRNAAKYSPRGSVIAVHVFRRDDEVRISVRDSGDGIERTELERVFERGIRGSRHADSTPGAGIGLAISREIVNAHGGRIWAESEGPGLGSTFTIAIPAVTASDREAAPATDGTAAAR